MRGLLSVILAIVVAVLCWGLFGPILYAGQRAMASAADDASQYGTLRPLLAAGLAYAAIVVVVPGILLHYQGERGGWAVRGLLWSLAAGVAAAAGLGATLIVFRYGGRPIYIMPILFGGVPVVYALLTTSSARRMKQIGPAFLAGVIMVLIGALALLIFPPTAPAPVVAADHTTAGQTAAGGVGPLHFALMVVALIGALAGWGVYGPALRKGHARMNGSRLRPLIGVGLAVLLVVVLVPALLLAVKDEPGRFTFAGTLWSVTAGAAASAGALAIALAHNFGGKPFYIMPLVFGGAPVVNTFATVFWYSDAQRPGPIFHAGLILVIAGAMMVLFFSPRGGSGAGKRRSKPAAGASSAPQEVPPRPTGDSDPSARPEGG